MFAKLRRSAADVATMQQLLPAAERLAHTDGADRPGAEHLVLAALDHDDGAARRALAELGADRDRLHQAVVAQHAAALDGLGVAALDPAVDAALDAALPHPPTPSGAYRSQGSLQALFQRAVALAKDDRSPLRGGHVLLAATEAEHGTLARSLAHLGIDRQELRDAARRQLRTGTPG